MASLIWIGTAGCAYTVRLVTDPPGATVLLPDGAEIVTPDVATFAWRKHQFVRIEAIGYRTLVVDMHGTEGTFIRYLDGQIVQQGGREVTFVLVPEHPPVGGGAQ